MFAILVIAAVASLLFKMSKAPSRPHFSDEQLVSKNAVLYRIGELSKSYGAVERGRGIECESVFASIEGGIRAVEARIGSEKTVELWEKLLYDSKRLLSEAIELGRQKMPLSKSLGHINGVPRLFLFCDILVGLTCGCFDKEFLKIAVDSFCDRSPFDDSENELLYVMLLFCLCGHIARAVEGGNNNVREYECGLADGKSGNVALDLLSSHDYVCGLTDGAKDKSAVVKLLEDNAISSVDSLEHRRERQAELAAFIASAVSTLNVILNDDGRDVIAPPCNSRRFFGGETIRKCNVFENRRLSVACDNRGNVNIKNCAGISAALSMEVNIGGKTIALSDMDGVFQHHRTVYRTVCENAEVVAEVVSPPLDSCCAVRLTVINRTSEKLSASVVSSCLPIGVDCKLEARHIKDIGVALSFGGYELGLTSDAPCVYSSKAFEKQAIEAKCDITIEPFEKANTLFVAVVENRISAARLSVFDNAFFRRAVISSLAYYADNSDDEVEIDDRKRFLLYETPPDRYERCVEPINYIYERGSGGFTQNGYLTEVKTNEQRSLVNFLFDGEMFVETAAGGDSFAVLSDGSEYGDIYIALDENGVIWSPCGELSGDGAGVELCRGYTTYTSYRNGCVTSLTRSIVRGKRAEVLLLTIENRTDDGRDIDVMCSARAREGARILKNGDNVYALGDGGFALFSSICPTEHCEYVEGYLDHGRIARASHFKSGGETAAPTISVSLSLAPREVKKLAFCRAVLSGGLSIDGISTEAAEKFIDDEKELYDSRESIVLKSSDPALNIAHRFSLYLSCAGLCEYMRVGRYDRALLSCFGVKYADIDVVIDSVLKICEMQESCGRVDVGKKTAIATLLLPLAVIDIVNYVGDCRLLSESVCFKSESDAQRKYASVLEHCLRAIDFSVLSATRDKEDDGAFCALLLRAAKTFIDYSGNGDRTKAYSSVVARLSKRAERGHYALATADIEFDPLGVATAYARYEADETEYAYAAVSELTDKAMFDKDGLPLMFSAPDGVTAALYYAVVAEKLLGVSLRGDRAKISPNTSQNTPHIEFDICRDRECTHIYIDDSLSFGGWQVCLDKISIASETVSISGGDNIVMRRRGNVV